jgi:hypothetical protein
VQQGCILCANLSWMWYVCHVTVSKLVSINDSGMAGQCAEMSGKSSICRGEADPSLALCVHSVLKVW